MRLNRVGSYVLIVVVFNLELVALALHGLPRLEIWQWAILPFAVIRMGRMVAFDGVLQPFRQFCVKVVPHDSGAGDTTESCGDDNFIGALGDLLTCPICAGTHVASVMLLLLSFVPGYGQALLYVMAAIGVGELLHGWLENQQWAGEVCRERKGEYARARSAPSWPLGGVPSANGSSVHFVERGEE